MVDRDGLLLLTLHKEDLSELIHTFNFPWTSLEATREKWERYDAEQEKELRAVCIAKLHDKIIGYGSLLRVSDYPSFQRGGIPEIHDVWISAEHRGKGFGQKLIQKLEEIALREHCRQIGIGVGLYKDYGAAQKLYVGMGYVPDGKGATYKGQPVVPGESYPVDDDLVIWLIKDLF